MEKDELRLNAVLYQELINDMQARIFEYENENPGRITDDIRIVNSRLSAARMESRIYVDEEHFRKWDRLLTSAGALLRAPGQMQGADGHFDYFALYLETLVK